jgi:hypothetical protein
MSKIYKKIKIYYHFLCQIVYYPYKLLRKRNMELGNHNPTIVFLCLYTATRKMRRQL